MDLTKMRWTESLSPLALSLLLELGALVLFGRLAHEVSEGNTLQFDMAIRIHPWP